MRTRSRLIVRANTKVTAARMINPSGRVPSCLPVVVEEGGNLKLKVGLMGGVPSCPPVVAEEGEKKLKVGLMEESMLLGEGGKGERKKRGGGNERTSFPLRAVLKFEPKIQLWVPLRIFGSDQGTLSTPTISGGGEFIQSIYSRVQQGTRKYQKNLDRGRFFNQFRLPNCRFRRFDWLAFCEHFRRVSR